MVFGFNEVVKSLKFESEMYLPKLIIFAVDIQNIPGEKGTVEMVKKIREMCVAKNVPYIYSCSRKELGLGIYGRKQKISSKISVLSVINC